MVHNAACPVLRLLDLAHNPLPIRGCVAMNDYAKAAIWCTLIAAVAYAAPKVAVFLVQHRLMKKAMFIPVEASYEERSNRGDYI